MELVSYAAVEEDGTSGLVMKVFDDLDKVSADVVNINSYHYSSDYSIISRPKFQSKRYEEVMVKPQYHRSISTFTLPKSGRHRCLT